MRKIYLALIISTIALVLGAGSAFAQRKPIKPVSPKQPGIASHPPKYELHLNIAADGGMSVAITSTGEEKLFANDLNSLIADLPGGTDKLTRPNNSFPDLVISADPQLSMLGLWNPITLFRRGATHIRLLVPGGTDNVGEIEIAVPWEQTGPDTDIMPNPLTLVVAIADDGALSINGDAYGTIGDTRPLSEKLRVIFKAREDNGVFRPESNDVEKSVTIAMPMSERKVADIVTIARAIRTSGADRISLVMDSPGLKVIDARQTLLDVPESPAAKAQAKAEAVN